MAVIALSCAEVARRLGCSAETVRRQVHAGEIPRLPHVGARILVPTRWLDQVVDEAMSQVPTGRVGRGAGGGPFEPNAGAAPSALAAGAPAVVADAVPSGGPSSTEQTPGATPPGVR